MMSRQQRFQEARQKQQEAKLNKKPNSLQTIVDKGLLAPKVTSKSTSPQQKKGT